MQHNYYILFLCLSFISSVCIGQDDIRFHKYYFYQKFNTTGKNSANHFYCIESMSDGGFVTVGFGTDTATGSPMNGILTKFDCLGEIQWSKNLGLSGGATNTNFGVAEASNGDIVYCFNQSPSFFQATMHVARMTSGGNLIWSKRIGTIAEFGRDMIATSDGGFVIAGSTGAFGTDTRAADIYLLKIDGNGTILWNKTYGNPNGTYDEAFTIDQDSKGNLFVSGRCINRGTFMCFAMKTTSDGEPIKTIAIGKDNHSTNGYALDVLSDDKVAITGYTSILETNFQSRSDMFVFKLDNDLNKEFLKVYEPILGDDLGSLGEGIVEMKDGALAVVAESASFTTHNIPIPQGAGKWLGAIIEKNGDIRKAHIFNHFGSQYPRICKAKFGGYFIGGFSTENTLSRAFQGLVIKTNEKLSADCTEEDVTTELQVFSPDFIVEDFIFQRKTGGNSVNNAEPRNDIGFQFEIVCEDKPTITAKFSGPDTLCIGTAGIFTNQSTTVPNTSISWTVDGKTFNTNDLNHSFESTGLQKVTLLVSYACITSIFEKNVFIKSRVQNTIEISKCDSSEVEFGGKKYTVPGIYVINETAGPGECEKQTTLKLNSIRFESNRIVIDNICDGSIFNFKGQEFAKGEHRVSFDNNDSCRLLVIETMPCDDCVKFPNVITPAHNANENAFFRPFKPKSCNLEFMNYDLKIYNRFGQRIFETNDPNKAWDGRYKAEDLGTETFVYTVKYDLKNMNSETIVVSVSKKGDVTLIR